MRSRGTRTRGRGNASGPRGRRGGSSMRGGAVVRRRKPRPSEYDAQDVSEIKAMLDFYTEALSRHPARAPELLRKTAVSEIKSEDEIRQIIASAFAGKNLDADEAAKLTEELLEINKYALCSGEDLRLKSNLNYSPEDIAKMVKDAAIELVLDNQPESRPEIMPDAPVPAQPAVPAASASSGKDDSSSDDTYSGSDSSSDEEVSPSPATQPVLPAAPAEAGEPMLPVNVQANVIRKQSFLRRIPCFACFFRHDREDDEHGHAGPRRNPAP